MPETQDPQKAGTFTFPSQLKDERMQNLASLSNLLLHYEDILSLLRREFRGEALFQDKEGNTMWVQVQKPLFIKKDKFGNPLKTKIQVGQESREIYLTHDDAINDVVNLLKFTGINRITPITTLNENEVIDDLKEIECKLAALLALKQKEWGIDKELLPIYMVELKTIIKDARYLPVNGTVIKALRTMITRMEQAVEGEKKKLPTEMMRSPYK